MGPLPVVPVFHATVLSGRPSKRLLVDFRPSRVAICNGSLTDHDQSVADFILGWAPSGWLRCPQCIQKIQRMKTKEF